MISLPESVKNEYKDFNREINVFGIFYLAQKRLSKNLFGNYTILKAWIYQNLLRVDPNTGNRLAFIKCEPNTTYTISRSYITSTFRVSDYTTIPTQTSSVADYTIPTTYENNNGTQITYTTSSTAQYLIVHYGNLVYDSETLIEQSFKSIQVELGSQATSFEEYGVYVNDYSTFYFDEANQCKILGFNIEEKADLYYTSVPYNTMTIEVDNEKGYFTDFDPDNIIDKLNEDCYVNLYMSINSGQYYKIMSMNFDKIKYSDYEKAQLEFCSSLGKIKEYNLKDKNQAFVNGLHSYQDVRDYILDNYNINLITDHPYLLNDEDEYWIVGFNDYTNLIELILSTATGELGQLYGPAVLVTNNYENKISLKAILNEEQETITSDLQLERPIIKREDTYKGVYYNWHEQDNWVATNETYNYTTRGKLNSARDTLILADESYRLSDITISDITSSSNVNVTKVQITNPPRNLYQNMLSLVIEGNIGDDYDLSITKTNMYKNEPTDLVKWPIGQTNDTSKILEIKDEAPIESSMYVFLYIKKPVKSNVEIKIMGLPYLEIGDTIYINQDNRLIKVVITEINTTFNDGLLQTIKGYELDWAHKVTGTYEQLYGDLNNWEGILPADDLYPANDLYPIDPY